MVAVPQDQKAAPTTAGVSLQSTQPPILTSLAFAGMAGRGTLVQPHLTDGPRQAGPSVLVGYDGSASATAAIDVAARLLPTSANARVVYLWRPPFASPQLQRQLRRQVRSVVRLAEAIDHAGAAEARAVAARGAAAAELVGWDAQPVVQRCYGGDGYAFARLATRHDSAVVVLGSRGLSGVKAVLDSSSRLIAHRSPVPALIVPHPMTPQERADVEDGPVLVLLDGAGPTSAALTRAAALFPGRTLLRVTVGPVDASHPGRSAATDAGVTHLYRRGRSVRGVAQSLVDHAAENHAAVVAVEAGPPGSWRRRLLGAVARALPHHAGRPVLLVPSPTRGAARGG